MRAKLVRREATSKPRLWDDLDFNDVVVHNGGFRTVFVVLSLDVQEDGGAWHVLVLSQDKTGSHWDSQPMPHLRPAWIKFNTTSWIPPGHTIIRGGEVVSET